MGRVSEKKLRDELTPNRRIFCDEWIIDRNGQRAYRVAYPNIKSDEVAASAASRLLTVPKVEAYLSRKLRRLKAKAEMTREQILLEERRIASSDFRQLFSGGFTAIEPGDLPDDIARAVAGVDVRERIIYADGEEAGIERTFKYKLWDKGAALNRLEKIHGMHQADKFDADGFLDLATKILEARKRLNEHDG